ncbi:hypothetical protein [Spongiibacter sp.]|uniref:hypothetical protein n=1 Tax=Spongiibacter sp. TaxID=2024860 RepID=UPI0035698825
MTRIFSLAAFALGALVIVWMGSGFIGGNGLAVTVTLLIALAYVAGFVELWRYQQATAGLNAALADRQPPAELENWLAQLPASLTNVVRQRIQGEYVGLPAPVLTPYLVGLLVMLGLLGTFIGMVDTLKGAVMALEGSSELEAIRAGLAAPIRGLGLAFGTSVAGVTASAMLGFISTLSRRDRVAASRLLDTQRDSRFKDYSLTHNRQQTYAAMQQQAQALPAVAEQLTVLAERIAAMGEALGSQLNSNQQAFHQQLHGAYQQLAESVGESLKSSLADSGRQAGESIKPVVAQLLGGIEQDLQQRHGQLHEAATAQLSAAAKQFDDISGRIGDSWQQAVAAQQRSNGELLASVDARLNQAAEQLTEGSAAVLAEWRQGFELASEQQQRVEGERLDRWQQAFAAAEELLGRSAATLADDARQRGAEIQAAVEALLSNAEQQLTERREAEAQWQADFRERNAQLSARLAEQLQHLRDQEAERGAAAVQRLDTLQAAVGEHLVTLGQSLEAPLARLIESASETPRVAAELMEKLRAEMTKNIERDNDLLDERRQLMTDLAALTDSLQQSTEAQREAVTGLMTAAGERMDKVAANFADSVDARAEKLAELVDHVGGSAVELASLGEAFGAAVQQFGDSSGELQGALSSIGDALTDSTARSDEQMAYYVAQAREIIDHNLVSQQEILSRLQALSDKAEQLELDMSDEASA